MTQRRRTLALLVAGSCAAGTVGFAGWSAFRAWRTVQDGSLAFAVYGQPEPLATPFLGVPARDMVATLNGIYRLPPDRRAILAVAEIRRTTSSTACDKPAVSFEGERWQIKCGNETVGGLSELPDFQEIFDLLVHLAKEAEPSLAAASSATPPNLPSVERHLEQFLAPHAFSALEEIDRVWTKSERKPALLRQAARALVLLQLQALDHVELADALPAKALATLARAHAATSEPLLRERALLAERMGYSGRAESLARELPEKDARRLYILRQDDALEDLAARPGAGREARYLWLLRLAALSHMDAWQETVEEFFPEDRHDLPLLKTGLELRRFETNAKIGSLITQAVRHELDPSPRSKRSRVAKELLKGADLGAPSLQGFEEAVHRREGRCPGPFLDGPTCRAYYESLFYSALYHQGFHYLDALSSLPAAEEFAGELGEPTAALPREFQRWFQLLVSVKAGRTSGVQVAQNLISRDGFSRIGFWQLNRLLDDAKRSLDDTSLTLLAAARRVAQRMDTRVEHRRWMATLARDYFSDLRLMETLTASAVAASRSTEYDVQARLARLRCDRATLERLAQSSEVPVHVRLDAVQHAQALGAEDEEAKRWLVRIIEENPEEWTARQRYASVLEKQKNYAEARKTVEDFLRRGKEGFDRIFAHNLLARLYYREGRFQEGWKAVEPVVGSQQGGAMSWAALLLDRLGRTDEAEAMATAALERYPDSEGARGDLAAFYWRHNEYRKAAKVLQEAPQPLNKWAWAEDVAPEFVAAFAKKPVEETVEAFEALAAAGFDPYNLLELSDALSHKRHREAAFATASQLKASSRYDLGVALRTYHLLKAWKGKAEALRWLKPHVDEQYYASYAMSLYYQGDYELLWELLDDVSGQPALTEDFVWMVRAIAFVHQGMEEPRRADLVRYFEKSKGTFAPLGSFLMGLTSQEDFLRWASGGSRRSAAAYCVGLRALSAGDYPLASDWFRVASETGSDELPLRKWALMDLGYWKDQQMSLAELQQGQYARGRPRPEKPVTAEESDP